MTAVAAMATAVAGVPALAAKATSMAAVTTEKNGDNSGSCDSDGDNASNDTGKDE